MSFRSRLVALLILTASVLSCDPATSDPVTITITPTDVEIFVGSSQQLSVIDAPTTVVWSSSNDAVASVVPETGFVVAIARGSATITATSGSSSAQVTVTVLAPRSLAVAPPSLSFQALVGAANPASKTVVVSNAGDGAISNIALGTTTYGDGEPTGWLSVSQSGSTAPVTLTFNVSTAGLPRGTYSASVPVIAAGIDNSPQQVLVTFAVQAPAVIAVNRNSVTMQGIPGVQIVEPVLISNTGDVPLTGLSHSIIYNGAAGQTWLNTSSLGSTTAPSTLSITANTAGLAPAVYTATVRIASTVPGVANRDIAVTLTVIPGPSIALSSNSVVLNAAFGVNPQAPTVGVTNGGGGTLSGLSFGTVTYGAGQPQGWLVPTFSGVTTAPATITLNITSAALANGTYNATVPVLSNVATNSPQNITVTLTVGTAPTMVLSRTTVPMSGIPGTIQNETVNITSSAAPGTQILGLSRVITYQAGQPQGWLTSATFNQTTTPSILTLIGNSTGLTAGVYTATVAVSATTVGVLSRNITVTFTVTAGPTIALSPNPVPVSANFGINPANMPVNITNSGGGTLNNLTVGAIQYTSGTPGWLNRALNSTTAPTTITLSFASSGLAAGSYSATVPVTSTVAGNSPQTLVVNLTVGAAPVIALNPNTGLNFAAWGNQAALPSAQNIAITNTGGSSLSGLSVSVAYGLGTPTGWLNNLSFIGGTTAPTTLSVQPSTTDRNAGTYTATITLSSSAPGVTSRTINVSYVVQTFTANVHPFFGPAGCGGCHDSGIRPPVYSATPLTYYDNLNNNGNLAPPTTGSKHIVCKIFGACSHSGGKFTSIAGFQSAVNAWIAAGAPRR